MNIDVTKLNDKVLWQMIEDLAFVFQHRPTTIEDETSLIWYQQIYKPLIAEGDKRIAERY